jgi:hypothetical protein
MGFSIVKLKQRRALILTCPALDTSTPLRYCQNDGVRMKKYLMSDYGGAWQDNEIILLNDVTIALLNSEIDKLINLNLEYFFFYFSGHGSIVNQYNVIQLKDTPYYKYKTIPSVARKEVFITDSCRKVIDIEKSVQLGDIGELQREIDKLQPSKNSQVMDTLFWKQVNKQIRPKNSERTYINSCGIDELSIEDPNLNGGLFTTLLLEQSVAFRKNGMIYGEYFYKILEMVQKEMGTYIYDRQLNHKQNIATEGLLDVPFILPVLKPEFR